MLSFCRGGISFDWSFPSYPYALPRLPVWLRRRQSGGMENDHAYLAFRSALEAARHLMAIYTDAAPGSIAETDSRAAANEIMDIIEAYPHLWPSE
ncbi:MAG: hypothetical protein JWR10_2810 [Rubritepida sp.]|nr:hypothetical protein [Rubritepida sp.]